MRDMALMLSDYRLTTAEILYHMPDHPALLQSFVWQRLDIAPDFPHLTRFLSFWERSLDGQLHSVTIASVEGVRPGDYRYADAIFDLH